MKSIGALQARQLSYSACEFDLVDVESDASYGKIYEEASKLWVALYGELLKKTDMKKTGYWGEHLRFFQFLTVGEFISDYTERFKLSNLTCTSSIVSVRCQG